MTTRVHKIIVITGATLLALALSAAFLGAQSSGAPTTAASYVPPTDSMSGQSMLEMILRANREAIRQARATLLATRSSDTRRFAETIIDEHSATMSQATALWDRLNYTRPDSSSTTVPVSPDTGTAMGAGAVSPADADRSYAANQVSALESLSTQLRQRGPAVQDPVVRAFAMDVQTAIDRELAVARQLAAPPPAKPAGQ